MTHLTHDPPRVVLFRMWDGIPPLWLEKWLDCQTQLAAFGFDTVLIEGAEVERRAKRFLDLTLHRAPNTRKAGDWDPFIPLLFPDIVSAYDFWGHVNLDCLYGRLDHFFTPKYLAEMDIYADDPGQICGPFSLYRNCDLVNNLVLRFEGWQKVLTSSHYYGFDETEFSRVVNDAAAAGELRFLTSHQQANDSMDRHKENPWILREPDGTLMDICTQRELLMFHFNRRRQWPI